ncbi:YcaO-like family protein [Microvirga massiliensis]|uniref:YcaO-like family protein n=1 Tax=Microvirga massiliensis TaxID=1033741 RepID=UPI000B29E2B5|nr:YcaO-like family protein [Microvirga massiliensis]
MPAPDAVPERLRMSSRSGSLPRSEERSRVLVESLLRRRAEFGITRVGCITRLDRIGIPVVQVVRPLSLSNAVSQGKGLTPVQAAASALMEELEVWAGENLPRERIRTFSAKAHGPEIERLYGGSLADGAAQDWAMRPMAWIKGWDLFTARVLPVPLSLVDTVYTLPSPHPEIFPRTTTGLGAGATMEQAIIHAALEILERDAVAAAHGMPHFFNRQQVDPDTVRAGAAGAVLDRIRQAGMLTGIWRVPARHGLPAYWCHVMEPGDGSELAPLPAAGFGCDGTHDGALARALLEACQARLSAISGAREDITRRAYPASYDRGHLASWRQHLRNPDRALRFELDASPRDLSCEDLVEALKCAGARAALVVPLHEDAETGICIVRVVAPPLRPAA